VIFFIGHRGVGKTSLGKYFENFFDLDSIIGNKKQILKIFKEKGEPHFRDLEFKALDELLEGDNAKIIALGAGFDLRRYLFPPDSVFIWIQRASDDSGRVFLDRPKLLATKDALKEFLTIKKKRDKYFSEFSDFNILLDEGKYSNGTVSLRLKKLISGNEFGDQKNFYTPRNLGELKYYAGPVELRTDFFSEREIVDFIVQDPNRDFIVALRRKKPSINFLEHLSHLGVVVDAPLELYPNYDFKFEGSFFHSLHEKLSINELKSVISKVKKLKWAPVVESFSELLKFDYLLSDKSNVSFLPRDKHGQGKFRWYRTVCRSQNFVNYFRFGQNDYLDQPLYLDLSPDKNNFNGAVLGKDTKLSYSPSFHREFFLKVMNSNYVSISMDDDAMSLSDMFTFLKKKSIKFLSVTSPYKNDLAKFTGAQEPQNTAYLNTNAIESINTDKISIADLIQRIEGLKLKVCVWGEGALGRSIYDQIKQNEKEIRSIRRSADVPIDVEVLIWACGSETSVTPKFINNKNSLKFVFDLEYKEHSFARKLAQESEAQYISGMDFFEKQAEAQQVFFQTQRAKEGQ